ncbi:MAG: response regulator [Eggerthellaceae bacterium]
MIRLSLTKEGYSCACAYDGAEAADLLERERYDLVLLDVMLPETTGSAEASTAPQGAGHLHRRNAVADRVQGLRAGAEDYIVKPSRSWSCCGSTSCCAGTARTRRSSRWAACRSTPTPCRSARTARRSP